MIDVAKTKMRGYQVYLEYFDLIIVLWNYPPILKWTRLHRLYLGSSFISTVMNAFYANRVNMFVDEENVLENYETVLVAHVYRTLANSMHSYVSMITMYSINHPESAESELMIVCGCIHLVMNYLYYFGELQHENALFVKHMPHMIDIIIILYNINDIQLQAFIVIMNIIGIYMITTFDTNNGYFNKILSWIEAYIICEKLYQKYI